MLMMLSAAKEFRFVQNKVAEFIKGRILVGHALRNDLKVSISVSPTLSCEIVV